jgi:NAD-dependent deacetylase
MDELSLNIPNGLIAALRGARHVTALTGAGISAESGVPTFRDAQTGLWVKYRAEDLATPEAFQRNPQLVWEWYAWRRELIARAAPNPGHQALVEMETRLRKFTLITQNVDGLHQRAGSTAVIELHGNITRTKCFQEGTVVGSWAETDQAPPRCPHCGGPLRPDVVWFGESLPSDVLWAAMEAARACDLFFSIGTSALVQPAALLPLEALQHSATVVEVNPDVTPLSAHVTYAVHGPAGQVLPAVVRATWPNP